MTHPEARARILFVDDDPSILEALRRIFRRERTRWDMVFVDSGQAALSELRCHGGDVVVSDLRMPQMDGAALLGQISVEFPATMRIVLSGYADSELYDRASTVSHVMLTKPCEHTSLRDTIAGLLTPAS